MGSDRLEGVGQLAERLRVAGAVVVAEREGRLEIESCYGVRTPMIVRWLPGRRVVHVTQPLEIDAGEGEAITRAALAVARLNQLLPTPALSLDVEAGLLEYRTRLFTDGDGALDFELFEQLVASSLRHVERLVPVLDEQLRGEERDLESLSGDAQPWRGYVE